METQIGISYDLLYIILIFKKNDPVTSEKTFVPCTLLFSTFIECDPEKPNIHKKTIISTYQRCSAKKKHSASNKN